VIHVTLRFLHQDAPHRPVEALSVVQSPEVRILLQRVEHAEQLADEQVGGIGPVGSPPSVSAVCLPASTCGDADLHRRERSSAIHCSASMVRPALASSKGPVERETAVFDPGNVHGFISRASLAHARGRVLVAASQRARLHLGASGRRRGGHSCDNARVERVHSRRPRARKVMSPGPTFWAVAPIVLRSSRPTQLRRQIRPLRFRRLSLPVDTPPTEAHRRGAANVFRALRATGGWGSARSFASGFATGAIRREAWEDVDARRLRRIDWRLRALHVVVILLTYTRSRGG